MTFLLNIMLMSSTSQNVAMPYAELPGQCIQLTGDLVEVVYYYPNGSIKQIGFLENRKEKVEAAKEAHQENVEERKEDRQEKVEAAKEAHQEKVEEHKEAVKERIESRQERREKRREEWRKNHPKVSGGATQ